MFLYGPPIAGADEHASLSFNKAGLPTVWTGVSKARLVWYGSCRQPGNPVGGRQHAHRGGRIDPDRHGAGHAAGAWGGAAGKSSSALDALLFAPMIIPDIVLAIALLSFFTLLEVTLGLHSIILSHVVFNIAFVCAVVRTG